MLDTWLEGIHIFINSSETLAGWTVFCVCWLLFFPARAKYRIVLATMQIWDVTDLRNRRSQTSMLLACSLRHIKLDFERVYPSQCSFGLRDFRSVVCEQRIHNTIKRKVMNSFILGGGNQRREINCCKLIETQWEGWMEVVHIKCLIWLLACYGQSRVGYRT